MKFILPALMAIVLAAGSAAAQQSLRLGTAAPAFSGSFLDGTPMDLESMKGRVVVMTFWSTRCAICHHELPKMNALAGRHNTADVAFLALSMENPDKIRPYVRANPFRFQIVPDSFGVVLKYADRGREGNLDMGFPSFFVIDQSGVIRHRASGYDKIPGIDAAISRLLAK